jgi:predicted enzyme involved in methoxymalonyl-ACP biosynthesis
MRPAPAFLAAVSYRDKFGPLGTIAVLQGRLEGQEIHIATWVMSCRAFARRIEYQCLAALFQQFEARAAWLDYKPTAKNGPLRGFLEQILGEAPPEGSVQMTRDAFEVRRPRLYHALEIKKAAQHSLYG